jgi:hypothetical protein
MDVITYFFNDCVTMFIKSYIKLSLISLLTFGDTFNYATRSSSLCRTSRDIWNIWNVAHSSNTRDEIPVEESGTLLWTKLKRFWNAVLAEGRIWLASILKVTVRILLWKVNGSYFVVLHIFITKTGTSWNWKKKKLVSVNVERLSFSVITTLFKFRIKSSYHISRHPRLVLTRILSGLVSWHTCV